MKVDLETEVSPIVGTEQQSEDLVRYLLSEFENDPKGIYGIPKCLANLCTSWSKKAYQQTKYDATRSPENAEDPIPHRQRSRGGVICILL